MQLLHAKVLNIVTIITVLAIFKLKNGISFNNKGQAFLNHDRRGGSSTSVLSDNFSEKETEHEQETSVVPSSALSSVTSTHEKKSEKSKTILIRKRNGLLEPLGFEKLHNHLKNLSKSLSHINTTSLTSKIIQGCYTNMTSSELTTLSAETSASIMTQHFNYGSLAARICVHALHQSTPATFSEAIEVLQKETGFISPAILALVKTHKDVIDKAIVHERDYRMTYFGYKTLERSYLLKSSRTKSIIERPQYMYMRVALGIHANNITKALETYQYISRGFFIHATPTLFYSGTTHAQLSSCFLVQMAHDSIVGIYDTLKTCALISKSAGGIGLSVHNIRARGTEIKGTRGISNGLVPMLRVFDVTSRYVDQGGGKRNGAFAIYIEPWHADIFDLLNLKKNHGKEEQRARNLFYGLWIPDLFMKRVENDGVWSLFCPHLHPGLAQVHSKEFDALYTKYETEGTFVKQVRARDLWNAILESQIETGTPYLLYKDSCNAKSNQKNLGTIQCSNLCTEIVQFTSDQEVAVCNLASICLDRFVVSSKSHGSPSSEQEKVFFDHEQLHKVTKIVTRNLNNIIDINQYPIDNAKRSNQRHRPIGIGVSGLADAFIRLGYPFTSPEAKKLNEAIFETMYHAALEASVELAQEKGSYQTFQGSPASQGLLQFHLWNCKDSETPSHANFHSHQHYYGDLLTEENGYNWNSLKQQIKQYGLRNSLLIAPMPTASTSQILGVNECFEPFSSNLYLRRVKAGEFIMANVHLLQDLTDRGLWNDSVRNQLMKDGGSVINLDIPQKLKELYKTVWELKMKDIIDMAADRAKFIDQSQSLNLFLSDATMEKLTSMHFYAWKKGLKTGMYYLRTRPAVNAIQYTVKTEGYSSSNIKSSTSPINVDCTDEVCISCQG